MKRKAEIKVIATFVLTGELTDAKWKKLVGSYFEPTGCTWAGDHPEAIESWADSEISEVMTQLLEHKTPTSVDMPHLTENSDGAEEFLIECIDAEYDGIELTDSL